MRTSNRSLFPIVISLSALLIFAASPSTRALADEPNREFIAESTAARAEVKLLYPSRTLQVSLLDRDRLGLPDAIQVSLITAKGTRRDLEITAMSTEGFSGDPANQRTYSGRIPPGRDSYIGVSIKIPFTRGSAASILDSGRKK